MFNVDKQFSKNGRLFNERGGSRATSFHDYNICIPSSFAAWSSPEGVISL